MLPKPPSSEASAPFVIRHSSFAIPPLALPDWDRSLPALVGVSGGRDSVALLHLLVGAGFTRLIVCHLDHALRPESRADARFVAALAEKLGLSCEITRTDVAALARKTKRSLETAARDARLAFFARCARRHDAPRLFLGHHAGDQIETFLFRLLRGAGPGGLAAMSPLTTHRIGRTALEIARPLLAIPRDALAAHAPDWREDASNADPCFTRNRIRHTALPALETALGREVTPALLRVIETLRAEDDALAALTPAVPADGRLPVAALHALPLALRRRWVHAWLRHHAVPDCGAEEIEIVLSLLDLRRAKANLPGAHHVRRRAGVIFLEKARPPTPPRREK